MMAATYPGGVKSFTTKVDGTDIIAAADVNDLQDEVAAIETELKKTTGSTIDHGGLAGLSDNDHPQYMLAAISFTAWTPGLYTGWTELPTGTYKYVKLGDLVIAKIDISAGTSNDALARIGLPYTASGGAHGGVNALCVDNGTVLTVPTRYYIGIGVDAKHIQFHTDMGNGVFTDSGTKRVRAMIIYETDGTVPTW